MVSPVRGHLDRRQAENPLIPVFRFSEPSLHRTERNARFHHGEERGFTEDNETFQMAARFEQWGNGLTGKNRVGREINVSRSFQEGLVELQREFNVSTKSLIRRLDQFYDILEEAFESRFGPRIRAATHGLNAARKMRISTDEA